MIYNISQIFSTFVKYEIIFKTLLAFLYVLFAETNPSVPSFASETHFIIFPTIPGSVNYGYVRKDKFASTEVFWPMKHRVVYHVIRSAHERVISGAIKLFRLSSERLTGQVKLFINSRHL